MSFSNIQLCLRSTYLIVAKMCNKRKLMPESDHSNLRYYDECDLFTILFLT